MPRDSYSFDPRNRDEASPQRDHESSAAEQRSRVQRGKEAPEIPSPGSREQRSLKPEREDSPQARVLRNRTYLLRESELRTMSELGTFRVVAAADLARFAYASENARMERDVRRLKEQGLVSERTLAISGRKTLRVLALTKSGKRIVQNANRLPEDQRIYHGIVKPREAKHDAELYRLFQVEAARIESAGGKPLRVLLNYELKANLNRDRARLGDQNDDPQEIERLADGHGLAVVNGKIPLPDMRIEYQTAELELRHVDVELATRHYRPRGIAAKAKAGFSLYIHREDATRLRRILDEQELSARIFAL
jgi:hypothetical protein